MNSSLWYGIVTLLALLLCTVPIMAFPEDNTQWNNQLNVCVYHYRINMTTASLCYVGPERCIITPEKPLTFQTLDLKECRPLLSLTTGTVTVTILPQPRPPLFKRPA